MLEIKNLSFSYNKKSTLLKDISFTAQPGQCVGIIGKNGVGKSTLMKCIINTLKIDSGEILLDGSDVIKMSPNNRAKLISYVPQQVEFGNCTVYDAILIGRKPYFGFTVRDHDLDVVDDVIKKLHLEHITFKNVNNLSGGERQKVAFARALVQQPKLLYLDEPTSNLDIKNKIEVLKFVQEIARQEQIIVLVNIHNLNLALHYFDTLILMKEGSIAKVADENNELTKEDIKEVFDVDVDIIKTEDSKKYILIKEE